MRKKKQNKPHKYQDVVSSEADYQCGWTGEWLYRKSRYCLDCKQHTPCLNNRHVICQKCTKPLEVIYETVYNPYNTPGSNNGTDKEDE